MTIRRFVSCGEALIDLLPTDEEPDNSFSSLWRATSAGGPMTAAIALRRLGEEVSFLGRLSNDAMGRQLRGHLQANDVDLSTTVSTDDPTSVAVITVDDEGHASYTFHFTGTANFGWQPDEFPVLAETDWLHTGTLAVVVEPGAEVLLEWARGQQGGLSLDLNVRPTLITDPDEYWGLIRPWLVVLGERKTRGGVGIVKGSDDDVNFLAQAAAPGRGAEEVLQGWVDEFGIDLGLLTTGPTGAIAFSDYEPVRAAGHQVDLVDTIGAGDTFMAGFLSAYGKDRSDVQAALDVAVAASALVVTRVGAQPPTLAELEEFRARQR